MLITDPTPADEAYAGRIASLVMASFSQQSPDPKTMLRQITTLCLGVPRKTLTRMVDPRLGVVAESDFLTLKLVKDWLDRHRPSSAPEHRVLPALPAPEVSPEERARRVRMLKAVAQHIRDAVKATCIGRPPKPLQQHSPDALLAGLDELERWKAE